MLYDKLNAYYIEDSQVKVDEGVLKAFPFNKEEKPMVLPVKNTMFILVGENVSISSKAIELLSANNVFLSFMGKDIENFFCNNQKFILPENYSLFLDKHGNQETSLKRERFLSRFQKFLEDAWEDSVIGDYFYTDDKEIKQVLKKIKECKEDTVLEVFGE
jgi:CRISPR/Cas system-associated endonuclease Cas1